MIEPPAYLKAPGRELFLTLMETYEITDEAKLQLLASAAERWDRITHCREIIEREGITVLDRYDKPRQHPAIAVESKALSAFHTALRQLKLGVEPEFKPAAAKIPLGFKPVTGHVKYVRVPAGEQ